jgi:hypothetical protein
MGLLADDASAWTERCPQVDLSESVWELVAVLVIAHRKYHARAAADAPHRVGASNLPCRLTRTEGHCRAPARSAACTLGQARGRYIVTTCSTVIHIHDLVASCTTRTMTTSSRLGPAQPGSGGRPTLGKSRARDREPGTEPLEPRSRAGTKSRDKIRDRARRTNQL